MTRRIDPVHDAARSATPERHAVSARIFHVERVRALGALRRRDECLGPTRGATDEGHDVTAGRESVVIGGRQTPTED
jgi:hypothetical protein